MPIFLIGDDEQLIQLNDVPYDSEDLLQQLLAKYPAVALAGHSGTSRCHASTDHPPGRYC